MTEKRFEMIITGADGSFHYLDKDTGEKITSTLELENKLNALHEENQRLKDQYERKDRQLKRTKKDIRKYADYFMNELNWDCERIIEEVFR